MIIYNLKKGDIKCGTLSKAMKNHFQKHFLNEKGIDVIDEMSSFQEPPIEGDYEEFDDNDGIDDDDEDENGIKGKLAKRYNSLTSLLMKSFRKAKKKKKEQMQRMLSSGNVSGGGGGEVASLSTGEVKLLERTNFEDRSEYRHHQQPQPLPRTTTGTKLNSDCSKILSNSIVSQTQSVYMPRRGSIKSNASTATAPANVMQLCYERGVSEEDDDGGGDPESMPVFIGVKVNQI